MLATRIFKAGSLIGPVLIPLETDMAGYDHTLLRAAIMDNAAGVSRNDLPPAG